MTEQSKITFTKAEPEEVGIPSSYITKLIKRLEKNQVPMHSLLLLKNGKLITEGYYAPFEKNTLHRMYSISKSVTALVIGILESQGKLSLEDRICSHFPEYCENRQDGKSIHPWIQEMTIRNMMMMRTCHASTTYKINMNADWVESFFITNPTHKPGTVFHYDTSAAHVLSSLVEKISGKNPWEFLRDTLPTLDLSTDSYMLTDPFGVSLGGSGLVATSMDILKLGYLLMENDSLNLLPKKFTHTAIQNLSPTCIAHPLPSESCGYGYMIWQNERGGFTLYGMGGQLVIVIPSLKFICVTTADTQGMAGGNQLIYDALYEELVDKISYSNQESLTRITAEQKELKRTLWDLTLSPLTEENTRIRLSNGARTVSISNPDLLCYLHSPAHYRITDASFPSCKEEGRKFTELSIAFPSREEGMLTLKKGDEIISLSFGMGHLVCGEFPDYQQKYAASGIWITENTLYLRFHIIDAYMGSVRMELHFDEGSVTVFSKKIEESLFWEYECHLNGILVDET